MRTRIRYGFWGAVALALGCSSPQSEVEGPVAGPGATGSAPQASAIPAATGEPAASAEPTGIVAATSTPPIPSVAPPDGPVEKRFLPLDVRCEKDADCAVTKRGVHERLFCCDACDAVAGGKAWVARADLRCGVYDKEATHHTCPARDCAGPRGARCNHGACELVP